MAKPDLLGRWGEAEAAKFLRNNGYRIISANYRCRFGEIDIIAQQACYIVFVEVKLRKNADFGSAAEFVDSRKQNKLRTTASMWLAQNETELQPRFDVIEIYAPNGMNERGKRINHIINAFQ